MHASNALARTEDAAWASVDEAKAALDTAGKDASQRVRVHGLMRRSRREGGTLGSAARKAAGDC